MRRRQPPEPQAIDPASGFKVPHRNLVRQWDGEYIDRRFVDKRNPQDLIRAKADSPALENARPEPADSFVMVEMQWEDDSGPIFQENGGPILLEATVAPVLP